MDAKTLRASILQMAIEGKLVPQLDEETAVEQIGEAPAEVPFAIPEKWKWASFDQTCKCVDGKRIPLKKADRDKLAKKYRYFGATGVIDYVDNFIFDGKYLLIGEDGANLLSKSKDNAFIVEGQFWVNNHAHIFSEQSTIATLEFLATYINAISLAPYVTGTAQPKLAQKNLMKVCVPLPPLGEQRRIVTHLNKLLPLVDEFGKAQEAMAVAQKEFPEKLKASLLQEAIQGKLVPQLDNEPAVEQIGEAPEDVPFAIPEKWTWANFNTVITTITTKKYQIPTKEIKSSGKFPVISQSKQAIDGFSDDIDRVVPTSNLPCVLFGDHTRVVKKITAPCIIGADGTKLITSTFLDNDFLFYLISSISPQLREAGYSRHFKFLKAHPLPIPPIAEQRRIVARLNELLPLVDRMAAQATADK